MRAERDTWNPQNNTTAYNKLHLPRAPRRAYSGGVEWGREEAYYTTRTPNGTQSTVLYITNTTATLGGGFRANGYAVRCIKDLWLICPFSLNHCPRVNPWAILLVPWLRFRLFSLIFRPISLSCYCACHCTLRVHKHTLGLLRSANASLAKTEGGTGLLRSLSKNTAYSFQRFARFQRARVK